MLFHTISGFSTASAEAALSSAVASAGSAFSQEAKSIHVVVLNVVKMDNGWKAVVQVIVEPNLDEEPEEDDSEHKKEHKKEHEKEDNYLFAVEMLPDHIDYTPLEETLSKKKKGRDIPMEEDLPLPSTQSRKAPGKKDDLKTAEKEDISASQKQDATHEQTSAQIIDLPLAATPAIIAGDSTKKDAKDTQPSPYDEKQRETQAFVVDNLIQNTTQHTQASQTPPTAQPTTKKEHSIFTYVHIPSPYRELHMAYSALTARDTQTYIHLIEKELWHKISGYLLDVFFYEATHSAERERKNNSDERPAYKNNLKTQPTPKKHAHEPALVDE